MATKKRRNPDSAGGAEAQPNISVSDKLNSKPLKKKLKNDKQNEVESTQPDGVASTGKDMEKKKKRKALDKEKKRVALENKKKETPLPTKPLVVEPETEEADKPKAASSVSRSELRQLRLAHFTDLVSADASIRESAAESLVLEMQAIQRNYESGESKDLVDGGLELEAEKNDGLDNCEKNVRYAVRRLIRGVSSSRECARQGFALCLTLAVANISSIKVDSVLKLILDSLEVSSSMKGQEKRECLLGRLFAYGAIARSGRLNKEWLADKETPLVKEFTSAIISLAANKRYLQEPAIVLLLDLVEKLPAEAVLNHVLEAPGLHEWFEQATDSGNPDALLLALKIRERVSPDHEVFGKLLPSPFSSTNLFSSNHLLSLVNCLKESTFCQPRIHSVWPVLASLLLPDTILLAEDATSLSASSKKHKKGRKASSSDEDIGKNLQCFCEVVIDGCLLSSSHDRKHLAFDVLLLLFPRLPASFIPIVLSYKLVQCLIDVLSTKESWLHKAAQHFLQKFLDWVRNDDARRVAAIVSLQKHSDGKFDCLTRTKTVKDLTVEFESEEGCTLFLQNLMNMFLDDGRTSEEPSDVKWALDPCSHNSDQSQTTDDNSEIGSIEDKDSVGTTGDSEFLKSWVIESLPSILNHAKLAPEAKLRVEKQILKFLGVQGLFCASLGTEVTSFELQEKFKWPKTATPTTLCKMCIEQLQSLLLNSRKIEGSQSSENDLDADDLGSYFMRFLGTLRSIPSVSLYRSLSEDDEKAFKGILETESKLSREERNCGVPAEAQKLHALRYLLIQLLLQLLLQPGEFSGAAFELMECCKRAFPSSHDLPDNNGDESDDDAAPELMDVLVDTLLSLLPQSSASMRSAIEQVFKYFCDGVTNDGLLRMLRVIKKDLKPARHQDSDLDDDEDDEDCLAIEEEEEEEDDEGEDDVAETGETGDSDEQTDDSEAVLGSEARSKLPENSDDSDEGMDDDAMFRMDTYLAQIFKEKKNQAGGETAQSQLVLFKLRILSLLEIYLHENAGKPQVLTVYSNLVQALINPSTAESSEQLMQRIWGILQKKIFKSKESPRDESIQLSTLASFLEKSLKLASKPFKKKKTGVNPSKKKQSAAWNRYKTLCNLAQSSTYWVLKIIDSRKFPEVELQKVLEIFQAVLVGYFDSKKSQIKIEFLEEVFRRRPWIGHSLFGFLLEKCSNAEIEFRRVEALDLVTETLRSQIPSNSADDKSVREASRKIMNTHLQKLSLLIKRLVTKMPEKQARRAHVRKFCGRIFQMVSSLKLTKSLLKDLGTEGETACESALADVFLNFKKTEN